MGSILLSRRGILTLQGSAPYDVPVVSSRFLRAFLALPPDVKLGVPSGPTMVSLLRDSANPELLLDALYHEAKTSEEFFSNLEFIRFNFSVIRNFPHLGWAEPPADRVVEDLPFSTGELRGLVFLDDGTRLIRLWDHRKRKPYYYTTHEFDYYRDLSFHEFFEQVATKQIDNLTRARELIRSDTVHCAELTTVQTRRGEPAVGTRKLFVYDEEQAQKFAAARGLQLLDYDRKEVTPYGPFELGGKRRPSRRNPPT